ncbi:MAG: thioredoxin family protein [Rhodobacterales bacterium]
MCRFALILIAAITLAMPALAETRLLMFEQPGCMHCAQWHAEVGPGYPLSSEGQAAPLWTLPLRDALPDGITLDSRPAFTPTFVLVVDGQEKGRIEGYPGAHFFWSILALLLQSAED